MNYRTVYKMNFNNNSILVEELINLCFNNNEIDAKNKIDDKINNLNNNIFLNYNEIDLHRIFRKFYQISKVYTDNNYYNNFLYLCNQYNIRKEYYNVKKCGIL